MIGESKITELQLKFSFLYFRDGHDQFGRKNKLLREARGRISEKWGNGIAGGT